jgi:hypothetical protein
MTELVGMLHKGTLYRVVADDRLSEKRALDHDEQVRYVGASGNMRAYVLVSSEKLVFVEFADDVERPR